MARGAFCVANPILDFNFGSPTCNAGTVSARFGGGGFGGFGGFVMATSDTVLGLFHTYDMHVFRAYTDDIF